MKNNISFSGGLHLINKEVVSISLFYLFVVSIGIFGIIHAKNVDQEYRYLLVSPSYFNDTTLNWTTSVWAGVLGIHGTIAALSITFMGMFVAQVSSYSEHGFEEICKSILLQKTKFLRFSMNSVLSLLSGIVLIACGGGIITYAISIFVSLCFILSYGSMYLKLYNVTETPTIISDYLFLALKKCRFSYTLLNKNRDKLTNQFTEMINGLENFTFKLSYDFTNNDHYDLNVFPDKNNEIITGFCATCFKNLNNDIKRLSGEEKIKIQFAVSFMYPLSTSRIQISVKKGTPISEEKIHKIANSIKKGIVFSSMPDDLLMYKKYEEALVLNIRNSLLTGNEWGLNFGVKAIFILVDELNLVKLMLNLNHSFGYTNKKNNVDPSIFAAFYEKINSEVRSFDNLELASQSLRAIINLARYLFTSDYFYDFYKLISTSLEHRAKYSLGDEGYCFFDLYSETVRDNILSKNYKAFELNTKFLTDEFCYLETSDDGQSLSVIETKMLNCVKETLTLLIIRLRFLSDKSDVHKDEMETISDCISHWLKPAFMDDLYYKEGTYDVLFRVPSEPDFDASRVLRDIPDHKVSSVSISNDTYIAIALLMTQSSLNKNNLNTIFIRNKKEFLENTEITTGQLQSIITYLKDDSFSDLMNLIKNDSSNKTNRLKIAEYLESIVAVKNETLNEFIANSDLDEDLIEKYKLKASMALDKFFNRIVDIHSIPSDEAIICSPFYSLIYKREIMQSIDGVHFSMNSAHHAEVHFFSWLHKILDEIKSKPINIIEIDNPNKLPSDRLVTIQYMVEGEQSLYQHSKGLRIKNTKGTLGLGNPGLYYMDFENTFKCIKNPNIFNVEIERISQDNISFVQGRYDFKGENALLYALMSTQINIKLINTDNLSLYYISVDACKKLTAFNKQTARLSLNDQKSLEELDDFS